MPKTEDVFRITQTHNFEFSLKKSRNFATKIQSVSFTMSPHDSLERSSSCARFSNNEESSSSLRIEDLHSLVMDLHRDQSSQSSPDEVPDEISISSSSLSSERSHMHSSCRTYSGASPSAPPISPLSPRIVKLKSDKRRAERFEKDAMGQVKSQFDSLRDENRRLMAENEKLTAERNSSQRMLKGMSWLVRSLQSTPSADGSSNSNMSLVGKEDDDTQPLTPQKAVQMTLDNNRACIEYLDEDRQRLSAILEETRQHEDSFERQKAMQATMTMMKQYIKHLEKEKEHLRIQCTEQQDIILSLSEERDLHASKADMLAGMVRQLTKGDTELLI